MDAKINWKGRMSFEANADSGINIQLGTDPSVGGDNDGLRPMELIAIGLGGCTAMDVISIMKKMHQDVKVFTVQVHAERANEHPKVFTGVVVEYSVHGHALDESAVSRSIELSAVRYCPAQAMLSKAFPIQLFYKIYEGEGDSQSVLVKTGAVNPAG